jgi:tight adherence protein B
MVMLAATFVIVFVIVAWAGRRLANAPQGVRPSWRERLGRPPATPGRQVDQSLIREKRASSVERLNKWLLARQQLTGRLQHMIDTAGVSLTPGAVVLACCFSAVLFYVIFSRTPVLVGVAMALVGGCVPILLLRYAQKTRERKFEEVFPDAIETISRALRAGHSLTTGIAIAADEVGEPVSSEFKLLYDWQNYGRPLDEALRAFAERAPSLDARFFVTAVLTQRETGGNLSEVLDNLVAVIRDRFAVKRQVRVLTAQGRLSGWILAAAPPVLAGLLLLINPDHFTKFVHDPFGLQLLAGAAVLQIIGTLVIRRIVDVEY